MHVLSQETCILVFLNTHTYTQTQTHTHTHTHTYINTHIMSTPSTVLEKLRDWGGMSSATTHKNTSSKCVQ